MVFIAFDGSLILSDIEWLMLMTNIDRCFDIHAFIFNFKLILSQF